MFKPDASLKRCYMDYRAKYFDNKLPADTQLGYSDTGDYSKHAWAISIYFEEEGHGLWVIHFTPELKNLPEWRRVILLHEMAHMNLYPYMKHGKRFNAEMLRLACAGALNDVW